MLVLVEKLDLSKKKIFKFASLGYISCNLPDSLLVNLLCSHSIIVNVYDFSKNFATFTRLFESFSTLVTSRVAYATVISRVLTTLRPIETSNAHAILKFCQGPFFVPRYKIKDFRA